MLQIVEVLESAHEKGVIHRDLRPAIIRVTPDGRVKVLDFSLAKAFAGEQAVPDLSNSPALSDAATQYDPERRAQDLGWNVEQSIAIDEDIGESAATVIDRSGFLKHLTANHTIILSIDQAYFIGREGSS